MRLSIGKWRGGLRGDPNAFAGRKKAGEQVSGALHSLLALVPTALRLSMPAG
jgi:hypothetical protein